MKKHPYLKQTLVKPLVLSIHLAITTGLAFSSQSAIAVDTIQTNNYKIPANSLNLVLNQFAAQSGVAIAMDAKQLATIRSEGLNGNYSIADGFARILQDTNLQAQKNSTGYVIVGKAKIQVRDMGQLNPIDVTAIGITRSNDRVAQLPVIVVNTEEDNLARGQVARKSRIGMLGEMDAMDTPFSVTSYTSKLIEDQQAKSVMGILRNDPSVRSTMPEGSIGEYFNIRGFYTQSYDMAWNGLFGLVPHNRTSTEFLERVEILRGASGLLNGMSLTGGVGGVINLVPKRADDNPITRLTTTFSSDSNLGAHLDVGRRLGENNKFGIRVNAVRSHGDTTVEGQVEDRRLGAIALDYRGERLRAALDVYNIKEEQNGGSSIVTTFTSSAVPKAPDPSINALSGADATSISKAAIANLEFDLTDQWTGYTTFGTKRQEGYGYLNDVRGTNADADGNYTAIAMNVRNWFDVNAAEIGLRGKLNTARIKHNLVFSANVIDQDSATIADTSVRWISNLYSPVDAPTRLTSRLNKPSKGTETELSSIALADTITFLDDKYHFILGLRHQNVKTKSFNTSGNVTGTPYNKNALTPAIGFVMKPWGNSIALYANYIEGLSQGGTVTDTAAGNYGEVFAPYKTKQVELGAKWSVGNFRNTLSVYQIAKPSLIKNDTTNIYAVDGEQRNRGIEWTTAGEVIEGLRLLGGITYIDGKLTKTEGGAFDGNDAIGVPHWYSNLGGEWDVSSLEGLTISANTTYTSSQYADNQNTKKIPSWTRLDLGTRYTTKIANHDVVFRGAIDNVFDKHYWAGIWGGAVAAGASRTYKLSLQIDF